MLSSNDKTPYLYTTVEYTYYFIISRERHCSTRVTGQNAFDLCHTDLIHYFWKVKYLKNTYVTKGPFFLIYELFISNFAILKAKKTFNQLSV